MDDLYGQYYAQHLEFTSVSDDGEAQARCPFHDDENPSFYANLRSGLWKCHGCGKAGDIYHFEERINTCDFADAKVAVDTFFEDHQDDGLIPIEPAEVEKWHKRLLQSSAANLAYLTEKRGLSMAVIEHYKIGHDGQRFTIPILNRAGQYVNVRRYDPKGKSTDKMVSYGQGYGRARLFPQDQLRDDYQRILVCEGEWDCLCAISRGIPAVTATSGAGSWNPRFNFRFKNKMAVICYDVDQAGKNGARKVAEEISKVAAAYILDLPLEEPANADLTNYFMDSGQTVEAFKELVAKAPLYRPLGQRYVEGEDDATEAIPVTLEEARNASYRDKKVEMLVRVSGKESAPYDIPRTVAFTCGNTGNLPLCKHCRINNEGTPAPAGGLQVVWQLSGSTKKHNPLELIKVSTARQLGVLKKWAGVPGDCRFPEHEVQEYGNLEEVSIIPEEAFVLLNDADKDAHRQASDDVTVPVDQVAYYMGNDMRSNMPYRVIAQRTVLPDSQSAAFLITTATVAGTEASNYVQTPDKVEALKVFRPRPGQTALQKMDEIAADLTYNVTKVYGREHAVVGMDFVFHSALSFYFQGDYEHRGWVEGLFLGDSRSGKSQIGRALIRHYKAGEMVNAESASFAGLIGGLTKTGNERWRTNWGRFVLNDTKLVFLDEANGLPVNVISQMSGVRTEGIAEMNKIRLERVRARTRSIWSANPRGKGATEDDTRPLNSYPYGITAIPELIGKAEDISRFEFAVGMATSDVDEDEPNRRLESRKRIERVHTSELCNMLLMWGWSRRADQVIFEREAENLCLEYATLQGRTYNPAIQLVKGANQRLKLARLAAAAAIRTFSSDATGEYVVVKPDHVHAAYAFLEREYSRPYMDYKSYSLTLNQRTAISEREREAVKANLYGRRKLAFSLLQYHDLKVNEVCTQMGEAIETTRATFGMLHEKGMLIQSGGSYHKSPVLVQILREIAEADGGFLLDKPMTEGQSMDEGKAA